MMMSPNMNPATANMPSVVRMSCFFIFIAIRAQMITVAVITYGAISLNIAGSYLCGCEVCDA